MNVSPEQYSDFHFNPRVAVGLAALAFVLGGVEHCSNEPPRPPIVSAETMYDQAIEDAVHQPDGDNCGPEIPLKFSIEVAARKSLNKYDNEIDLAQRKALVIGAQVLHNSNEPSLDNDGLPTEVIQVCESKTLTEAASKYLNSDAETVYLPVRKPIDR